ncbi:MAG TPA: peptidylprolyl isomerase, partial [Leucothrix mucor]|nr:peptidylprolyl isomerase [Leucothrix mucor]
MNVNKKTLLATSLIGLAITSTSLTVTAKEDTAATATPAAAVEDTATTATPAPAAEDTAATATPAPAAEDTAATATPAAAVEDTVVATVNGDKIMKSTLDGYLALLKKSGKVDPQAALDDLVATEVALQQAKTSGIMDRPDIQKKVDDFKRNLLLTTWTQEKVKSFKFSDEEIKSTYDERVAKLASKEYNARHILLKKEDEAKAVIKEIAGGADFEKL